MPREHAVGKLAVVLVCAVLALACGDDDAPGGDGDAGPGADGSIAGSGGGGMEDAAPPVAGSGADPDGAVPDGAVPDGATADGATADGATPDGATPDAAMPDGGDLDADVPECSDDGECDDLDVCNGAETCSSGQCVDGSPIDCAAPDACHAALCDATDGCSYPLIDGDADGHAATSLGACGTDCNDGDPAINPGEDEVAGDAADVDEDCDGAPTCFVNGDGDGYRIASVVSSADADCNDVGEARASLPADDCNDGDPAIHPGATEVCGNTVDENCSGATNELAECYISCDWSDARWLSHGFDGGGYTTTGAWVSCIDDRISYVEFVGTSTAMPSPSGTSDLRVGCNWSGNEWASQGLDGASAIVYGATVTCAGARVTAMSWESNSVTATTATAGDLGCNWTGARYLSHGIDGGCAFLTGFNVTCHNGRITHFEWVEGCPALR